MNEKNTFTVSRIELKRMLSTFKIPEKNIMEIIANIEKAHRHINVITFITLTEKVGLTRKNIEDLLRRLGMNDVVIGNAFDMYDQQKIIEGTGRLYTITISA